MQYSRMGFGLLAAAAMTLSAGFAAQAETVDIITITNGARGVPATVVVPDGEGPFPAVVLVHGSGPHDRDESIGPNKPFRDLAHGLTRDGIAVLRYEKRTRARPQVAQTRVSKPNSAAWWAWATGS